MITPDQRPQFLAAIRAYARWCRQEHVPYHHPDAATSSVGWKYVHLCTRQEHLARYDYSTGRMRIG